MITGPYSAAQVIEYTCALSYCFMHRYMVDLHGSIARPTCSVSPATFCHLLGAETCCKCGREFQLPTVPFRMRSPTHWSSGHLGLPLRTLRRLHVHVMNGVRSSQQKQGEQEHGKWTHRQARLHGRRDQLDVSARRQ